MIPQREYRSKIENKLEFQGSNCYAQYIGNKYVIYSYGLHFPMYAFINNQWYRNTDKYSSSTSRHQSRCRLYNIDYIELNTIELKNKINER